MTAAERVARGAAKLDEGMPGWADLLDPAHIDMRHMESDVISLLRWARPTSDQEDAALDHIDENDLTYGLTIRARADEPVGPLWDELRDLWRSEIERRS